MIRKGIPYVNPDGTLTDAGYFALNGIEQRLDRMLAAVAAVPDATGGVTVDAEARAELAAIKAALG